MSRLVISDISGCISIACWVIVFTPQLLENYRRKSAEGLSYHFIVIWLWGDIFNVLGALFQKVLPTMVFLAIYYTLADIGLFAQFLYYGTDKRLPETEPLIEPGDAPTPRAIEWRKIAKNASLVLLVVLSGVAGYFIRINHHDAGPAPQQPLSFWGQVLGWICAALYLASRIPQIMHNYRRKSTDGIAVLFFVFAVLGNLTYVLSIVVADPSRHALILNASWLAGSVGTLVLDFIIFCQFFIYR